MRFEVLGTIRMVADGQVVGPASELRRRLLAVLLVRANRTVAVDTLVDALWETEAPKRPASSLQVHIHRLRQVLDRPDRLRGVAGGYQLDVGPEELDASVFAGLHAVAREAAESGELEPAVARFREALALWRGAPYADIDEARLVAPEAKRLAEARMVAFEELYDAELELGRAREIVPELTELVTAYPLRERLVGQLMLALYRSGRQSRAEATYRATRQRLARELKTEPGRELRELFEAICSEDPSLDSRKPEPRTGSSRPAQLPPAPGAFLGREVEQDELDRAATSGLVVLTGMAGVGKTGLALHFGHQVADRYGDGQLYLDLRGHSFAPALDPLEALGHLIRGLGADPGSSAASIAEASAQYRSLVADRKLLVLLDNAGSTEQLRPLLPATDSCLTMITSRNRLSGLIAREGAHRISLGTLDAGTARALLTRLLGEQRVAAEPDQVTALIEACAGLPLALRIAAAQLADEPHRTLADYLAEFGDRGLSVLALDDDEQSAVAPAFDLSYQHLDPEVRRLFRLAGLIPGLDFTVDAAAALTGTTVARARNAVRVLTGAHLLEEHAAGRYRLHDLLRDYARQRALAEEPEQVEALNRLCTWYFHGKQAAEQLLTAWRFEPPCPPLPDVPPVDFGSEGEAAAWMQAEFENIVSAIRACSESSLATSLQHWCWHLAMGVTSDMERRGRLNDVLPMLEVAVAAARAAGDQEAIALSLGELGIIENSLGRPMSRDRIAEMLAAADQAGLAKVSGYCNFAAGVLHMRNSEAPAAVGYLSRALELQESAGDARGQALTLLNLGSLALTQGDVDGAARAYERMVEMSGDEMPTLAVAGVLNLCHALMTLGRQERLRELFDRGERLVEQLQDEARGCVLAYMRATWYRETGRVDESLDLLLQASRRAEGFGLARLQSHIHNELGFSYLALADSAQARVEFERAAALASSESMRGFRTHALRGLALTDLAECSLTVAESRAREAIEVAIGADRLHEADALVVLARVQLALGRPESAIEYGEQALAIHRETGHFLGTARAHHVLGEARADRDQLYEALRMFEEFGSPEASGVRRALAD